MVPFLSVPNTSWFLRCKARLWCSPFCSFIPIQSDSLPGSCHWLGMKVESWLCWSQDTFKPGLKQDLLRILWGGFSTMTLHPLCSSPELPWPCWMGPGAAESPSVSLGCGAELISHADLQQWLMVGELLGAIWILGKAVCSVALPWFCIWLKESGLSSVGEAILAALWQLLTRILGLETNMNQLASEKNSENWLPATLPGNGTKVISLLHSLSLCWNFFLAKILRLEKQSTKPKKKPSAMWFCCQKWQDSGWLKKPEVLGFPWRTEAEEYGLNSQVLICEEQVVWILPREELVVAVSGAEQGWGSGAAPTQQLHSPALPRTSSPETWASGKVLLQTCGFGLFNLWTFSVWKRKGSGQGRVKQEFGETLPSGWGLGLHLWAAEVIIWQSKR